MGKHGKMLVREEVKPEVLPLPVAERRVRWAVLLLTIVFVVDLIGSVVLYLSLHSWSVALAKFKDFVASFLDYHKDSVDSIVLAILRVVLLSAVAAAACFVEQEDEKSVNQQSLAPGTPRRGTRQEGSLLPVLSLGRGQSNGGGLREPLLGEPSPGRQKGWGLSASPAAASVLVRIPSSPKAAVYCKDCGEKVCRCKVKTWRDLITPKLKMDALLFLAFLLSTGFQVFVGAKCVAFNFTREAIQGPLMGIAVLWINLESTLVNQLVNAYHAQQRSRAALAEKKRKRDALKDLGEHTPGHGTPPVEGGKKKEKALLDPVAAAQALREGALRGDKGARTEDQVTQKSYLMRAVGLARQELPVITLGFLCLGVTSGASLVLPHYQGSILDHVMPPADKPAFAKDVFFLVTFSLVTGLFGGVRGLCFNVVGKRVLKTLQDKLFTGIVIQDVAYFDATTSGELTSRLTNDVSSMAEPLNWMLSTLLRNSVQLAGGFVMCFYTSWKLSMLAFTTMAPIMHITAIYSRWSRELNRSRYAVLAEANSTASEALGNIRTVRAFSTEEIEIGRYKSKTMAAMRKGVRDAFAYSGAVAINNWLDLGASVLILWYGGILVMDGHLSIGRLITFQLYWNMIQSGYQSVMSTVMSLTRAAGAAQRVLSLVDALPDIDPNRGTKLYHVEGDVKLEDVHFHYQMRPQHPVLAGVNLQVAPGQVCALVGRSGGGKSTIVHLLMRFYDPTRGRILLDNMDLRDLNLKSVHRLMGVVAQETQMFATSIEENITYGVEDYTQEELHECSRLANAHDFIARFPEGYATRVGERGVRLSGGQRQRLAIARMLLRRPRVLLLDEATSSLDTESEALVQSALDRLIQEGSRTVVLVAHRLSTVRNADKIGVMEKGRVVEQGTHDVLLQQGGVYSTLVRRQLSKERNQVIDPDDTKAGDDIDRLLEERGEGEEEEQGSNVQQ